MKVSSELKKINVANNLQSAEIHVIFDLKDYTMLGKFKEKLADFLLYLDGQKTLIPSMNTGDED